MAIANESPLEFLDLKLYINEHNKIIVDVYAKPTNSFTYVLPSTCYPKRNINNVPKGIALRLRRICDSDETFDIRSNEYQSYLIARDYNPSLVKKQFQSVKNITRNEARQVRPKATKDNSNLITVYNPLVGDLRKLIKQHLPILYNDPDMNAIFPEGSINITYKRGKSLKELISPSIFPQPINETESKVSKCGCRCDICDNFLVISNEFTCSATGKKYKVRGKLTCKSENVIYLVCCKACKQQYVGSAVDFKKRFRIHKSDINTGKDRCGVAKHFLLKCPTTGKFDNISVYLIEKVSGDNNNDIDGKLWTREKYWQAQLFTMSHGMNSSWDWYSSDRKGYRKNK